MKSLFYHLSLVALVGVAVGCSPKSSNGSKSEGYKTFSVRSEVVGESSPEENYHYVGSIEADHTTAVSFSVGGGVERIYVEEGQSISKGTLLAQLNDDNLSEMYEASKAKYMQAQDGMRRVEMMNETQSVAPIKYVEMQTQLREAQAMEAVAKRNLADSRLVSPVSGVVGRRMVEVGENVAPHQVIFEVLSVKGGVVAKLPIPEAEIANISLRDSVSVKVAALGGREFRGVVTHKGVEADPISRTYKLRVRIPNEEMLLLPGMVCRADVEVKRESFNVYIPQSAIRGGVADEKYVWVVNDNKVSRRDVECGGLSSHGVEVTRGLKAGDEVVVAGSSKLYEGAQVKRLSHE